MAGAGYKLFTTGSVLTASEVNTYLMEQTIMVFANATARDTALSGVLAQGMQCFLKDTNTMQYYSGAAWTTLSTGGDITSVVAGTGISGGGTSGDVTITNSMATTIDAKGDLIAGTANDTFARLAVGSNGDTLVADSSQTTGLRWQSGVNNQFLINGAFDIWQRGTSFTAASVYSADRWLKDNLTVSTLSRQSSGLTAFNYCARAQRNSGQTTTSACGIVYSMESADSIPLAGKTVVISFYARKGSNYSATSDALKFNLYTGTGTDQSRTFAAAFTGEATAVAGTATLTTSWQRFSGTATLSSSATQVAVQIYFDPTGTAGANDYFEITGVQLELGATPTNFKRAGNTLAGELAACQRYYWRSTAGSNYQSFAAGQAYSTTGASIHITNPVAMRIAPTSIDYSTVGCTTSVAGVNSATLSLSYPGIYANNVTATTTGIVAGNATLLVASNSTSAYIALNAEL